MALYSLNPLTMIFAASLLIAGRASLRPNVRLRTVRLFEMPESLTFAGFTGVFSASGISDSVTSENFASEQGMTLFATFSSDAVGSLSLEGIANDGATWSAIGGGPALQASGRLSTFATKCRLNCTLSKGSIAYGLYAGNEYFAPRGRQNGITSGAFKKTGDASALIADRSGGWLVRLGLTAGYCSPSLASFSVSLLKSVDGGATWTTVTTSSAPLNYAVVPGTMPAIYKVTCTSLVTMDGKNALDQGGIGWEVTYFAERDSTYRQLAMNSGQNYSDAYSIARWTPLADADISGDLTLYKVCAGNTFAKLLVPAAARRFKGPNFIVGAGRDIRAEYANTVSLSDSSGNA